MSVCVCVCVCVCARARARARVQVCRARPKRRGLTGIETHRTQTYLKIVIGQIQTHALQLHTLRMQTLEMVEKQKHQQQQKGSAFGINFFRRQQGFVG